MSEPVIQVRGMGKRYRLGDGAGKSAQATLPEAIAGAARRLLRLDRPSTDTPTRGDFWALRDINFDVHRGEVIGIVGGNGAGKSTLLKILSEITEPTRGQAAIRGRVASLLEVGTGFHPELTGRENIYLNGAILGLTRREIHAKFNAIVEFSGVEQFLDTPIKRYSSGMTVRLAFAVAAQLDPEILIVDEVLAVGDAAFQQRCLGKMESVAQGGQTVLLVSHNMGAIQQLSTRALMLRQGELVMDGDPRQVVRAYLEQGAEHGRERQLQLHGEGVSLQAIRVANPTSELAFNDPLHIELDLDVHHPWPHAHVNVGLENAMGARVLTARVPMPLPSGGWRVRVTFDEPRLAPGRYMVTFTVDTFGKNLLVQERALSFDLSDIGADPYVSQRRDRIGVFTQARGERVSLQSSVVGLEAAA